MRQLQLSGRPSSRHDSARSVAALTSVTRTVTSLLVPVLSGACTWMLLNTLSTSLRAMHVSLRAAVQFVISCWPCRMPAARACTRTGVLSTQLSCISLHPHLVTPVLSVRLTGSQSSPDVGCAGSTPHMRTVSRQARVLVEWTALCRPGGMRGCRRACVQVRVSVQCCIQALVAVPG